MHRVCCCEQVESSCSLSVTYYNCQQDGQPPAQLVGPLAAQVYEYRASVYTEQSSGGANPQAVVSSDYEFVGVSGIAIANPTQPGGQQTQFADIVDEIRQRYGTDSFGPIASSGSAFIGSTVGLFGFYAESVTVRAGSAQPNYAGSMRASPDVVGGTEITASLRHPTGISESLVCGPQPGSSNDSVVTWVGSPRNQLSRFLQDDFLTPPGGLVREYRSEYTPRVGFADYLDSYTGPRTLCLSQPSTAPGNDAAIEAALMNDPLRRCKGCGQ